MAYDDIDGMDGFAESYTRENAGRSFDIPMLAMFCVGLRRELLDRLGPLDERLRRGPFRGRRLLASRAAALVPRDLRKISLSIIGAGRPLAEWTRTATTACSPRTGASSKRSGASRGNLTSIERRQRRPIAGHIEPMSISINRPTATSSEMKVESARVHGTDLRGRLTGAPARACSRGHWLSIASSGHRPSPTSCIISTDTGRRIALPARRGTAGRRLDSKTKRWPR